MLTQIKYGALDKILDSLGMSTNDAEPCAESEGYRIDFEQNFTVELQRLNSEDCRISARIFSMGKSLQVQDEQIRKAMEIMSELVSDTPRGTSLAISGHDNCLRMCIELEGSDDDRLIRDFHGFIHFAFAYKQTYFKHKNDKS